MPNRHGFEIEGFDEEQLEEFIEEARQVFSRSIKYVATDVWGNVRRFAPTDHGRLAGSFDLTQDDWLTWRIYTNVHYALYVHGGTGVHGPTGQRIRPQTANALSFYWKRMGMHMIVKSVAGQEPNPFMDKAKEATRPNVQKFVQKAFNEIQRAG